MKKKYYKLFIKVSSALALGIFLTSFPFYSLESFFYDYRLRFSPNTNPSGKIVLILIDKNTLASLGREPNLIDHGLLLSKLSNEGSSNIVSLLNRPSDKDSIAERTFFSKAANSTPNFYFGINDVLNSREIKPFLLKPPLENVKVWPAPFSSDKNKLAADDVSRRLIIKYEDVDFIQTKLASLYRPINSTNDFRGIFNYYDILQTLTDVRKVGSYPAVSFIDVVEGRFSKDLFRDKIIIIGRDAQDNVEDYVKTPLSRDLIAMSKAEYFANMVDTLGMNTGIVRPPEWLNRFITIVICLVTLLTVFRLRPAKGMLTLLALGAGFTLIAWAIFAIFRVSISMTHPLLAIFVSYYFFIPYRLIQESRKSWEYQQKHKLLTEVERLKTNFLSMMSHDLKTPLARIQGMADVALAHPESLRPEQDQALKTISASTQELTTFISSILDLSRVESEQVKLHLQSKDINALLDELLSKYEDQAKLKNITFVKEFEPLFSIKIDVDLMRQVFSNLIENAIKYSEPNSKVLVSTEELDGKIIVQVADQGIGIPSDEIENVFLKFYRTDNVKNSPIKGSGLGLFLAKYFVELHKGDISVESEPKQGSTFTVSLPMQ